MSIKVLHILFLFSISISVGFGQSLLSQYMAEVDGRVIKALPANFMEEAVNQVAVYDELKIYARGDDINKRASAMALALKIGRQSSNPILRRTAVDFIIDEIIFEKDRGQKGAYINYLKRFKQTDFTTESKQKLLPLINKKTNNLKTLVLIIGFLEMEEAKEIMIALDGIPKSVKEARQLALIRMGDQSQLSQFVSAVKKLKVNDDFNYRTLPSLNYTREKAIFDYLLEILQSDNNNCHPADAETEGNIPCGIRIMEALANSIENFPLEVDEYGELITNNYKKAFETAKRWAKKNANKYTLDKNKF